MLPYAKKVETQDEKDQSSLGKRKADDDSQTLENGNGTGKGNKRQNSNGPGYAGFLKEQRQKQQYSELLEKYLTQSQITFADMGGIEAVLKELKETLEWPLKYKSIFDFLGVKPAKGILISGPPGTGKTQLSLAIAGQYPDVPFYKMNAPEIVSRLSGQSEENIRNIFEAVRRGPLPAIIFIDELDSIAGRREEAVKDMEVRIVAQIASCLDEINN